MSSNGLENAPWAAIARRLSVSRFSHWFEREFGVEFVQVYINGDRKLINAFAEELSKAHKGDQALGILVQDLAHNVRTGDRAAAIECMYIIIILTEMGLFDKLFKAHPDVKESFTANYLYWSEEYPATPLWA